MSIFVFVPAAATYYGAAAVGTAVVGAIGVTGLSAVAVAAIGAGTISAGFTLARGGDVEDALKAAVLTGATSYIGGSLAKDVGSTVRADAIMNGDLSFDVANSIGKVATSAVSGGAAGAIKALAAGEDPIEALIKGGLTAAAAAGVTEGVVSLTKEIPRFTELHPAAQAAIQRATVAELVGGNFKGSLINSAINFATNEAAAYAKRGDALSEMAKGGFDLGDDYVSLSPDKKVMVDEFAQAPDVTPDEQPHWSPIITGKDDLLEYYLQVSREEGVELAPDEYIIGSRVRSDGAVAVMIERVNPNNPEESITYEQVTDPETGDVYYERGGFGVDEDGNPTSGGTTVSDFKPERVWEAPEDSDVLAPDLGQIYPPEAGPDLTLEELLRDEPPPETEAKRIAREQAELNRALEREARTQRKLSTRPARPARPERPTEPIPDIPDVLEDAGLIEQPSPESNLPEEFIPEQFFPVPEPESNLPEKFIPEEFFPVPTPEPVAPTPEGNLPEEFIPEEFFPVPEPEETAPEPLPVEPTPTPAPESNLPEEFIPEEFFPVPEPEPEETAPESLPVEPAPEGNLPEEFIPEEFFPVPVPEPEQPEQGPTGPLEEETQQLPSQWKPNGDGTFTFTGDDGDTLTIDSDGNIVDHTDAPTGMLPGEMLPTPPTEPTRPTTPTTPTPPRPTTPTPPRPTTPTPPRPTTPTPPRQPAGGTDLGALLALLGGAGGSGQPAAPSVQENSADVQLMEDIFGPTLNLNTPKNKPAKAAQGGSVDELLKLLRG